MKKIFAPAVCAILAIGLAACGTTSTSAASRSECPALPADAPAVERSGDGVFPEVKGKFGEKPEFTPATGDPSETIQAKTLHQGDGPVVCADDQVRVNYAGVLWDGTPFDSSFDRGEPIAFSLNGVIQGWKYGLAGQKVGDRVLLTIPAKYGYGEAGTGNIPPNSPLVFVVDILDAIDTQDTSALENAKLTGNALPEGVTVEGDLGKEPKIAYGEGTAVTEETRVVIAEGQGEVLKKEDQVIVRMTAAFQTSEDQPPASWAEPQILPVSATDLADVKVGSRLAIVRPAVDGQYPAALIVVDVAGVLKADEAK